ncbi:MAG: sigma factor-like helix-turn-helix DNA-binding protein [Candidatus Sulfotelmatobacter sp.]
MSEIISWIAAESEGPEPPAPQHLPLHQPPATEETTAEASETTAGATDAGADWANDPLFKETAREADVFEQQRRRRVYRGRTAAMLQRYMRYALETGRIPSILGGEFFRSRVTSYGVSTFEDRAIFVHDMEKCLNRLDEMSRQILARVVLQGHDRDEAARLFGCTPRTLRRNLAEALDRMADILLGVGLLEALPTTAPSSENSLSQAPGGPVEKTCQGGDVTDFLLSDCEDGK